MAVLMAVMLPTPASAWTGTWGTAMTEGTTTDLTDPTYTVRHFVRVSVGGSSVRVRLSNLFGEKNAVFGRVTVAIATNTSPRGTVGAPRVLTFGGQQSFTLAPGASRYSDPLTFTVPTGTDLAVSIYASAPPTTVTRHRSAYQNNHIASGDHTNDQTATAFTRSTMSWYYLTEVAVDAPASLGTVVAMGDSITDGAQSSINANRRWPDYLARRLAALPNDKQLGVINAGISGNYVLTSTSSNGPSGVSRAARDITEHSGVRTLVLLEGINDIRQDNPPTADQLWAGYESIVATAHARGIRVLGGTLLPFGGSTKWTPEREAIRTQINTWIRQGFLFDGVVDFDAAVRDPADPTRMRANYTSSDYLHPVDAGYQAMADAVPLSEL